jgi:mannose-6-phosphate isomerase-like protein (cupin superfamily)
MKQQRMNGSRPSVIPRSDIPISDAPEDMGLEVRPFGAHAFLSSVVPRSNVSLAWTHAKPGQEVGLRSHSTRGLLIILDGSGELVGALSRTVEQGDVITIPRGHEYGFKRIGTQGLHALLVAFGDEAEAAPTEESEALKELLGRNEARAGQLLNNPFFLLLREGKLESEKKRAMMRECLRVFSDAFQTFLFVRQATCRDSEYSELFNEHLREEIGHNALLKVARTSSDPVLRATSTWFCHQMLVQDNAGKAMLNVVLETAGYYFHTLAKPVFEGDAGEEYFQVHAEEDEKHMELGIQLLAGHHAETYRRLERTLDEGWNMLDAMTRRVARLVELEASAA